MGVEIERKFLVDRVKWRAARAGQGTLFRQGYLSRERGRTVRVRRAGDSAFLTIKGGAAGAQALARPEFEYPIPLEDAEELLSMCDGPLIEKVRYLVPYEGHTWEVDEFKGDNEGLLVAEIELTRADETFALPPWALDEVTADRRYANSNLVSHPFSSWGRS